MVLVMSVCLRQYGHLNIVSVFLVGISLGGMSQGNPLGDLVHVYCFCERQSLLYHICLIGLVSLFFFLFFLFLFFFWLFFFLLSFCFSYHELSFGTLSLIIHLLVHYSSVYAPM